MLNICSCVHSLALGFQICGSIGGEEIFACGCRATLGAGLYGSWSRDSLEVGANGLCVGKVVLGIMSGF